MRTKYLGKCLGLSGLLAATAAAVVLYPSPQTAATSVGTQLVGPANRSALSRGFPPRSRRALSGNDERRVELPAGRRKVGKKLPGLAVLES